MQIEGLIGLQEEVLDTAHIATGANLLVPVPERVSRPCLLLLGRRQGEEAEGLRLEVRDELQRHSVVDHLEEPKLLAGLDDEVLRLRFREV